MRGGLRPNKVCVVLHVEKIVLPLLFCDLYADAQRTALPPETPFTAIVPRNSFSIEQRATPLVPDALSPGPRLFADNRLFDD